MSGHSSLLITGGAGYIGSHIARACLKAGFDVVILDRLCTGHRDNVPADARFVLGDISDEALVKRTIIENGIEAVIHVAGSLIAEESVLKPDLYYQNNTVATLALVKACIATGVRRFVYSSTAAVYGQPHRAAVTEDDPTRPVNPYGRSKLMAETLLQDLAEAGQMASVVLRYFNVAGVDPSLASGPRNPKLRSLFSAICDTVLGRQSVLSVFGTQCNTPDGSCVRDYINVRDLAEIHLHALGYLERGGTSRIYNCGYSTGISVLDVVKATEALIGYPLPVILKPKRSFDPEIVIADPTRLMRELDWTPRYHDLQEMISTSLAWARKCAAEAAEVHTVS